MPGKNKTPLLGWHPTPAELGTWVRTEAKRRGITISEVLNEVVAAAKAGRIVPLTVRNGVPDALTGFSVHAGWGNDGSADLLMRHDPCGWWLGAEAIPGAVAPEVHGHPFEGEALLRALAEQAMLHAVSCDTEE